MELMAPGLCQPKPLKEVDVLICLFVDADAFELTSDFQTWLSCYARFLNSESLRMNSEPRLVVVNACIALAVLVNYILCVRRMSRPWMCFRTTTSERSDIFRNNHTMNMYDPGRGRINMDYICCYTHAIPPGLEVHKRLALISESESFRMNSEE